MSEIKFRGQRIDSNEWVLGIPFCIKQEEKAFMINNCQTLNFTEEDSVFNGILVKIESLGQFIGIKDVNGKDIYEGDILNRGLYSHNSEVFFNKKTAKFQHKVRNGYYDFSDGMEVKIIGNIYENVELLTPPLALPIKD